MADFINDSLKNLNKLCTYLNNCPTASIRKLLATQELAKRGWIVSDTDQYAPIVKLRWLYYQLRSLEESDKFEITKSQAYTQAAVYCERLIPEAVKVQYKEKAPNEDALKQSIERQKSIIFNQILLSTSLNFLREIEKEPTKELSAQAILDEAITTYQKDMYTEVLYQFEADNLIERYDFLTKKKAREEKDYVIGHQTINLEIVPEMNFIQERLKNADDLKSFRLQGTPNLFLDDLTEFTANSVKQAVDNFIRDQGHTCIDQRVSDAKYGTSAGNNIKSRSFNKYFNNPDQTSYLAQMSQAHAEIDELIGAIKLPAQELSFEPVHTKEEELEALREAVLAYERELKNIVEQEKKFYANRDDDAIAARKKALDTLKITISQVDTITDETRSIAKALALEIKHNQPTWKELHWLDKILDIITIGLHVAYRYSMFKEPKAEVDLMVAIKEKEDDASTEENRHSKG
ncbi:Uncharacterised protein [Legionella beliardensis]|uniref:Uncharacterized protein n=1 Tax=Legionella beliardensis TaxID=91822 RepID=A0A378I4Z0_9GAMM|nr:hypothetical protein [Legionella beliardensis]STX29766.1 Uncharacterised protein [Legionella beliardensis]